MAGLISDIVGGNVDSDLDKLVAKLAAVEKELDVINGKAITIKVDLQGVGTLSELTSLYKQQDEILTKLRSTSIQYVDTYKMATEVIKQHNGHSKEFVAVSQGIAKTTLEEAKARKENAKALLDEQKYVAALAKEKERIDKLAAKEVENLNKQKGAYSQLNEEYKKAAKAAQDLGAQQELLNRQLSATNNTSQREALVKQMQDLSPALKSAQQNAMSLHLSLLQVDQNIGRSQRNVGNYNGALMSMSQILREAPSFANSFSTGMMGISNNIPILVDEMKKLKEVNNQVVAAGGEAKSTLGLLWETITSGEGIITIATAVITIFAARMSMASNASQDAKEKINELEDSIKSLGETMDNLKMNISIGTEVELSKTERLIDTYNSAKISMNGRISAYEDLQGMYPDILSALTEEEKKTKQLSKSHDEEMSKLKGVVALKNKMSEIDKGINASIRVKEESRKNMIDIEGDMNDVTKRHVDRVIRMQGDKKWHPKVSFPAKGMDNDLANQYLDLRDKFRQQERAISLFKQAQLDYSVELANMSSPPKLSKEKKPKKDTISDDLAAAKSDYELQLMLNQQKFANSRDTDMAAQQLKDDNLKATMEYGERYIMIVEDFNNRELLTENEHIKLINEANKILLEGQIKAKEAGDKIEEERLKKSIEANKKLITYIESLSKQRQELEKINREIDAIQDKAASRKEYAESFAPYLEGFGFNTAFGQQVKQKGLDIEAQREKVDLAREDWANEGAKGSMANPLELLKLQTKAQQEKKNLDQLEFEREDMYNQKMIEGKKELARKTVELAKTAFEAINTIRNNAFAAEQKQLEIQSQNLKLRTDQEMRAIDAKAGFEASKANEKTILAAQTAAKENEIRAKSNELAIRQARANKQAAQAEIISQTAVAIISTLASYAKLGPAGIAIGAAMSAAIAGIGAAQYAAVSSAPLPQYEKGTDTGTTSERFIAGEKGAELGITPSGKTMLFEKEGIYSAPLGTKIKTADQTKKLMQYAINGIGYNGESLNALNQNMHISLDDKKIVDTIKEQTHDIAVTLWKTKGNNNSSTQQAYIDAVREQQNLISKFK